MGPVPPPRQQESEEEGESGHVHTATASHGSSTTSAVPENYETIYALLSARSPGFRHCFSERLAQRLAQLQQEQLEEGIFPEEPDRMTGK